MLKDFRLKRQSDSQSIYLLIENLREVNKLQKSGIDFELHHPTALIVLHANEIGSKEIIINFIIKWNTLHCILCVLKHIYINIVDRYFYRHMSSYFYALSRGCAFRENRAVRLSISIKHRHSAATACCCTYLHKNLIDIFDIR